MKKSTTQKLLILIAAPVIVGLIAAFGYGNGTPGDKDMPGTDAEDFWEYISEKNEYKNWNAWPGKTGMYEGQSPHGEFLKLYVNKKAYKALEKGKETMPNHAIIVKENYNKKRELVAITPMYKVEGYDMENADWYWTKYGKDGKIMASGKVQSCIECHAKAKATDYLFSISE